jgi:hypothetical protein
MFNSMTEIHAAIRTMSDNELEQLTKLTGMMYEQGSITQDQAVEILGVVVAHTFDRSLKKAQAIVV